jgi:iron complex outermembrane receptor protein
MFDCTARHSAPVRTGLLLSSVCFFSYPAFSASDDLFDLSLKELLDVRVVTAASGYEQNIKDAPASVTVIEAAEWQARGARNLMDALRGSTSVSFDTGGGDWEQVPQLRGLSGESGQRVKILIDGVPINRIHDGAVPRATIPLHGFKRIEVVRSPGSVVYGADAFAGVINLVSYEQGEQPDEIQLTAGEFDTYDLRATKFFDWDGVSLQLAINYQNTDGDSDQKIDSDLQTSLDDVFGTSASLAPGSMNTKNE